MKTGKLMFGTVRSALNTVSMNNLCIIPARGGSKRIPRKNIKPFLGKPVIAYSIEAAVKSNLFDEIMVSTDDEEIAEVARKYGASVPFMRSAATADDFATTTDVVLEVIDRYKKSGEEFEKIACIYPTAPLLTAKRIKKAYSMLNGDIDSVFTCVPYSYPVQRGLRVVDGKVSMLNPQYLTARSQDLEPTYHDAGQLYISTTAAFLRLHSFWGKNTAGLILSELEVQDIDTLTDWQLAEMKYKLLNCDR